MSETKKLYKVDVRYVRYGYTFIHANSPEEARNEVNRRGSDCAIYCANDTDPLALDAKEVIRKENGTNDCDCS